jgi:hypothetical protein
MHLHRGQPAGLARHIASHLPQNLLLIVESNPVHPSLLIAENNNNIRSVHISDGRVHLIWGHSGAQPWNTPKFMCNVFVSEPPLFMVKLRIFAPQSILHLYTKQPNLSSFH